MNYRLISITLSLFLLLNQVYAQDANASQEQDACQSIPIENYNLGFRVGSIFIIFATTTIGTYAPILLHRISPYKQGDARDWILTIGKFFGTGVILATAFVHMLPDALENFSSPCLTQGWLSYGAFAGVFCMIASFALQLLEVASVSHMNKLRRKKQNKLDAELGQAYQNNEKVQDEALSVHGGSEHHIGNEHGHAHGMFLEGDEAMKHIGTYILELGIVMHSIIIGITLAVTKNDEFNTLLIALVFHQFFEGMALGTRLNEINYDRWYKPVLMGLLYVCTTPIGIAIGIGIRSSYNPNSYSAILSQAILDSLSAGILLYNAYVSLMSLEISHNTAFHNASTARKVCSFMSMYVGAGLMSLIGEWA
ncbi:high-affinity Zn(2+) transporter zrt1 [Rhizopus azygosporus]|uniref:High-affinity Zn(2+) transporter zrt1 n=1 Tax=Rhizopus azygosporus TaxID=86630 RepID=A0A367JMH0_RHIAZ|nr:high-affinity Zn(2+) transporter zrt1 [Rhizopus azygosporus]